MAWDESGKCFGILIEGTRRGGGIAEIESSRDRRDRKNQSPQMDADRRDRDGENAKKAQAFLPRPFALEIN